MIIPSHAGIFWILSLVGEGTGREKQYAWRIEHPWSSFLQNELNLYFFLGWVDWYKDWIECFLWAEANYSHHNKKKVERGFTLFYFCSWLLSSSMQVNLYCFIFYEYGTSLVRVNSAQPVPGERGCNSACSSRLHTFLLLLVLEMLWRECGWSLAASRVEDVGLWTFFSLPISVLAAAHKPQEKEKVLCWTLPASPRGGVGCPVLVRKEDNMGKGGGGRRVFFNGKRAPERALVSRSP